jgi:hypothetical protein
MQVGGGPLSISANPNEVLHNNAISSWENLTKLLAFFSEFNGHDWLFRGVSRSSHKLIPKIGRPHIRKKKANGHLKYSPSDEEAIFHQFKDVARPFIGSDYHQDIEWLAIAQHHGLPTRFLDWTESLLIAAWFAVQETETVVAYDAKSKKSNVSVFSPTIWVIKGVSRASDDERRSPFNIMAARSYRPPHISPRITAQRSVLTIHGDPTSELTHPELWKFTIEPRRFFVLKKRIDACGINERTLFPGLDGVARDLAWRYKNNWLAGYKPPC